MTENVKHRVNITGFVEVEAPADASDEYLKEAARTAVAEGHVGLDSLEPLGEDTQR